jgi:hypothetical protein
MPLLDRITHVLPPSSPRPSRSVGAVAAVLTALAVAAGVWVTGALLTDDATLAKAATAAWFGLTGALALLAALRWRTIALPVLAAYALTTASLGGFLLWTSTVDRVVVENVVMAAEPIDGSPTAGPQTPAAPGPTLLGRGPFRSGEHETTGTAALLRSPNSAAVVTLTDLVTSPGPDLRVYLAPGSGADVRGAVDLGALRGNRGPSSTTSPATWTCPASVPWSYGAAPSPSPSARPP